MRIIFSITLTAIQAPLLHAIKNYLDSYSIEDAHLKTSSEYLDIISKRTSLYVKGESTVNGKPSIEESKLGQYI
jgi:hypothetical protein